MNTVRENLTRSKVQNNHVILIVIIRTTRTKTDWRLKSTLQGSTVEHGVKDVRLVSGHSRRL